MNELSTLFLCLHTLIDNTTLNQLKTISQAMITMTGRVTMLGISRWTGKGGSYRTIQRFFQRKIPWERLNWALTKSSLTAGGVILIAGDATTVTKSGKLTHGLGKFFHSIYKKAVPGIAFQCLSLLDVKKHTSWPIFFEQISPKEEVETKKKKTIKKKSKSRGRGRPKGSKNKNKKDVELSPEMKQIQFMLRKLLLMIKDTLKPIYFVYDGAFGNNAAVQMVKQVGLDLISKLRQDSGLYFLWKGEYAGRGRKRIYGSKVDYQNLPNEYLKEEEVEDDVHTRIYQFEARHKKFLASLNIVIILKQNTKTGKQARVVLFSTNLELEYEKLINYYQLRFQIEFNFRDAKQYWGLEDFMVIKKDRVTNAANISMWMVNVSKTMLAPINGSSVLDLKARFRGIHYAKEVIKILPKNGEPINNDHIFRQISELGKIHQDKTAA